AAAQPAAVVVERPPRLVPHLLELQRLARREADGTRRASAQLGDEVAQRRHETLPRHALREAEGLAPLRERAVAGEQLVEALVRGGVGVRLRRRRPDAVAALDLVGVRKLLAREHAGVRA